LNALRDHAAQKYGIPRDHVLAAYTHTHYGPAVKGYDFQFYTREYEDFLILRATQCMDRAFLNQYEGSMAYCSVDGDWNISRRRLENGTAEFKPSPDNERDSRLYLMKLCDASGNLRALVTSFACHPSNLGEYRMLSGEYPARLCAFLEAQSYGCTAMFFQGSGGDVKLKIGAGSDKFHPISYEECNETAMAMARSAQEALGSARWKNLEPALSGRAFRLRIPLRVYPRSFFEEELRSYSGNADTRFDKALIDPRTYSGSLLMWACAEYVLDHYDELPDTLDLDCGILRLSHDFFLFTMGGEPSYDVKRVLQQLLPDGDMLFIGYTDAVDYIPSDKMLRQGGYEAGGRSVTEYRLKGECAPGIDQIFLESFGKALQELNAES